ncbi:MAG TPA: hypothetical protein VN836_01130 [Verrucomicrobiae bacterium]|nr:hypothetical protein [Verrucomicrobiae bacterium]
MKILCLLLLVSVSGTAFAQSSGRFVITRNVVAGGGTTFSTSSRFQLGGTVAQPLAAVPASARYSIQGGFWIWPAPVIFAPIRTGTNFVFSLQTEPGKTYTVLSSDSLTGPTWQTVTNISGDGSVKAITNSAPGVTWKYYRLVEQ